MKILKNKNLNYLWFAYTISHIGDTIYAIALPWLILTLTNSPFTSGIVTGLAYFPILLFGFIAGAVIDRFNRKIVMIITDILRMFTIMLIPILAYLNQLNILSICTVAFTMSTLSAFFNPSKDSIIPQLANNNNEILFYNSIIGVSSQMAQFIGPIIALVVIDFVKIQHLFTIDALTFLASIIFILFIKIPKTMPKKKPINQNIKDGLNLIYNNKPVFILLITTLINNIFIMGPAIIGIPVFVKEILNEDLKAFIFIEAAMAAGMIIGTYILLEIKKYSINYNQIMIIGILFDGLTFALLFFAKSLMIAISIILIHGIFIPFIIISRTTLIQRIIPIEFQGRIFSMFFMALMGSTGISILITGYIIDFLIPPDFLFLTIGLLGGASSLIVIYSKEFNEIKI